MNLTEIERLVLESFHQIRPDEEIRFAHVYGYTHVLINSLISEEDLKKVSDIVFKKTKGWTERYDLAFHKAPSGVWVVTIEEIFPPYYE